MPSIPSIYGKSAIVHTENAEIIHKSNADSPGINYTQSGSYADPLLPILQCSSDSMSDKTIVNIGSIITSIFDSTTNTVTGNQPCGKIDFGSLSFVYGQYRYKTNGMNRYIRLKLPVDYSFFSTHTYVISFTSIAVDITESGGCLSETSANLFGFYYDLNESESDVYVDIGSDIHQNVAGGTVIMSYGILFKPGVPPYLV